MSLKVIAEISRRYGSDPSYVLAGGGNTSFKNKTLLYIKPSGTTLSNITKSDFLKLDRQKVRHLFEVQAPEDKEEREQLVKKLMLDSVCPDNTGRPSVEAPLHEIFQFAYGVHLHPPLVNGMTCGKDGKKLCQKLFPEALWVEYVDPGYTLARKVYDEVAKFAEKNGRQPNIVFMQNHGVMVSADSEAEVDKYYQRIMGVLTKFYKKKKVTVKLDFQKLQNEYVLETAPQLRALFTDDNGNRPAITAVAPFKVAEGPFSPDHIVYAKSYALITKNPTCKEIDKFTKKNGYAPLVISVPGKAVFCVGKTYKDASVVAAVAKDAGLVQQITKAFGGPNFMATSNREFIENWEVESYRKKVAAGGDAGRLAGKIAVVTGAAQGFGLGIAEDLAREGATVAIADLNLTGAEQAANDICAKIGQDRAFSLKVNIADEDSVIAMVQELVVECGGVDIFVANAGVLKAGAVSNMTKKDWDFVTTINYSGYFLCVKHVSPIMAKQKTAKGNWSDIIQINSKSGLVGSNRNSAYAGSKFGTIGLTQSFALELIEDKIKVNSICPGNYFDGPLWSDPDNGLFVQYFKSGKVPGAKNVDDVRKFYEAKTPMNRGCYPNDVVKAILYLVDQDYETGQALPVTGGQVMLK